MKKGNAYIGTSGWAYKHWAGTFYPPHVRGAAQLTEYFKVFDSVELNNSFYRLPPPQNFEAWRIATPTGFVFSVKAPRFYTHMKKLIPDKEGLKRFFTHIDHLEEKLGPVLFQLPPRWKMNIDRLHLFLKTLPAGYRYTFEFREHSWYHQDVYELLQKFNCAFCIYELEHHISPLIVSADFVYIRLHGPGNKYQGSYPDRTLEEWASRIKSWQQKSADVFIYFDNDQEGYAAFNARSLQTLLAG